MKPAEEIVARARIERAAEWRARQRDGALSAKERVEFFSWLREAPANVAAYLEMSRVDADLQAAARDRAGTFRPLEADSLEGTENVTPLRPARGGSPRHAVRRERRMLVATAIVLVGAVVGATLGLVDGQRLGLPKVYETAHAEQGSWPLPDGSMLHLNSDSRVVVHYDAQERVITVERGQAMFQVAKDHDRRFRVDAGDTQVIAVGTEFDVYRRPSGTRVAVLEGRVAILRGSVPSMAPTLSLPGATAMAAGQQAEMTGDRKPPAVVPADLRRVRAWTQREIVLEASPLAEVVEDFNRYSQIPLEVRGDEVRALKISGVFGAYDVESLVEFLRRVDGVRVEESSARMLIVPASPKRPSEPWFVGDPAETRTPPSAGADAGQ